MDETDGKSREYGYYWLAGDWENLLASCIDCNRTRKHFDYIKKEKITLGKGNWFPLEPSTPRAVKQGDELRRIKLDPAHKKDYEPLLIRSRKKNAGPYYDRNRVA